MIKEIKYRLLQLGFFEEPTSYFIKFFSELLDCFNEVKENGYYKKKEFNSDDYPNIKVEISEKYHNNIQDFLYNIDWSLIEGNTPMSKTLNVIKIFKEELECKTKCKSSQKSEDENEENSDKNQENSDKNGKLLEFFKNNSSQKTLEKKQELIKTVKESELSSYVLGTSNLTDKIVNLTEEQKKIFNNLGILANRGKIKSDKKSDDFKFDKMKDYTQVTQTSVINLMMPTFNYKFATKNLLVKDKKELNKQLLVLAIDASGSMDEEDKIAWVKSLIINRLEEVIKGNSSLVICWFEGCLFENYSIITSKNEAINYLNNLEIYNDGGRTDVSFVIKEIEQKIDDNTFKVKGVNPQIIIINDGQDIVRPFKTKYQTHAFILGVENPGFKNLIINNGGHYERFL